MSATRPRHLLALLLVLLLWLPAFGAKEKEPDPYAGYDETLFMDMDLEQNLLTPAVGTKAHSSIRAHMNRLGRDLAKRGYTVDLLRDDEVLLITIPTDELFLPNDTLLAPAAPAKFQPILSLLSDPLMMKMVYAVHTDNTGSPGYNMNLSHERNISIYDWLLDRIPEDLVVIPYELGDTDPIAPNDSRQGRAENRRLEIYLIPGPKMITDARKGTLK